MSYTASVLTHRRFRFHNAALFLSLGLGVMCLTLVASSSTPAAAPRASAQQPDEPPAAAVVTIPQPPAPIPSQPASVLTGRRICIDPGHDAYWTPGATARLRGIVPRHPVDGVPLFEHELTLSVAYRLKALLEADGALVCVTRKPRDEGGGLQVAPYDYTGDGRVRPGIIDTPEIIQARIDWANGFGAELLVSVHFNGSEDARVRGTEVYYTDAGPRQLEGRRLAESLSSGLLSEIRAAGHVTVDRGIRSDRYQRYSPEETQRLLANSASVIRANGSDPANCPDCYRLVTMGNNPMSLNRGTYVGAVVEVEFTSNPDVVEYLIMRHDWFDIVARGLFNGLRSYFEAE